MSDLKRFEDWEQVDCNDCSHYWDSSCDGVSKGSKVGCNSFLATRSVVIPEKIKQLEFRVNVLEWATIIEFAVVGTLILVRWLFG